MKPSSTGRGRPGIRKRKKDPLIKRFSRTVMEDRRRRFKAAWCNIQPWLEYSQLSDSVYCYACRHFSPPNGTDAVFDPASGFKNWKKATYKEGGFAIHANSEQHKQAMVTWRDHQRAVATNPTLANVLKKKRNKQVKNNREYMKTIGRLLLFTAMQNIAERGHNEFADPDDKGNFVALLELIGKYNEAVKKRLSSVNNAVYTSKTIQKEVLDCLADMVRTEISEELKHSEVFSIMIDETKQQNFNSSISIVLRYYFNGAVQESFLHFDSFEGVNASSLSETIIHILESHGLDHRNNLVAQAHSGVDLLSGSYSGVQATIKEQAKYGFYIHSNAHCLNVVLVDAAKVVPGAYMFFNLLEKLCVFTSRPSVHAEWLAIQRRTTYEMYEGAPRELQRLSDTQGACRFIALQNIMDRLPALMRVLQMEGQELDGGRTTIEAQCLLEQMDLEFIVYLVTLGKVFRETKPLSDMLQSSAPDFSKVVDLVEALVHTLTDFRQESFFDNLWDEILSISEQCDDAIAPELEPYTIVTTVDQREKFRTAFFYPVIDQMLNELNRRFSKTTCDIMKSIQALNPKSDAFLQSEVLLSFARVYDSNIEHLGNELPLFRRFLDRKIQAGMQRPSSTAELTLILEPLKDVFVELFRLSKIAVAIPVSAASSENNFSMVNRVKNHLESTITDGRMCNLDVLCIEYSRSKALSLDTFVDLFAKSHQNRRIMLL